LDFNQESMKCQKFTAFYLDIYATLFFSW